MKAIAEPYVSAREAIFCQLLRPRNSFMLPEMNSVMLVSDHRRISRTVKPRSGRRAREVVQWMADEIVAEHPEEDIVCHSRKSSGHEDGHVGHDSGH